MAVALVIFIGDIYAPQRSVSALQAHRVRRFRHISPAAEYQVTRIAKANDMAEDEVREIVKNCTDGKFLWLFGEETVNVLKVNLMLDGIL